ALARPVLSPGGQLARAPPAKGVAVSTALVAIAIPTGINIVAQVFGITSVGVFLTPELGPQPAVGAVIQSGVIVLWPAPASVYLAHPGWAVVEVLGARYIEPTLMSHL